MEHAGVSRLFPEEDHFVVLTPDVGQNLPPDARELINELGRASARAQGLSTVITSYRSFMNGENRLYILLDDDEKKALGFAKTGIRKLFLWDELGGQHEMNPICLLDFFVMPETQRRGCGKRIIDKMLKVESLEMREIPIDRPSMMCRSFMQKHFELVDVLPQPNNFCIFRQFWNPNEKPIPQTPTQSRYIPPDPQPKTPQPQKVRLNPITWEPY